MELSITVGRMIDELALIPEPDEGSEGGRACPSRASHEPDVRISEDIGGSHTTI
jgi:hypothetical protein